MKYFCKGYCKSVKEAIDKEPLDIDFIILTQCNQKCSYCFMRGDPKNHEIVSDEILNTLANKIIEYKKLVDITLLGGEPTLHPKLKEIVNRFSSISNIENISIHTNGRKSLKNILKENLKLVFSIHPEYLKYIDTVIKHIREVQGKADYKVNILYHPFFKKEIDFLEKKLTENNIPFRRDIISGFKDEEQDFENDTKFNVNGEIHTLKYIMENNLNRFKNWKCLMHSLRVNVDGSVFTLCYNKSENILDKNYKLSKKLIQCTRDSCECAWALNALKITQ